MGGREGCSGDEEERSSEVMFWGMLKKRRDGAPGVLCGGVSEGFRIFEACLLV